MMKLKNENHVHLTEYVLKNLTQNRITTILEFLHEDSEKISTITKLSLVQILEIKNDIFKKYSAPVINGATIINTIKKRKHLCTGILSLDNVLNGGIPIGFITEICGLADSGKTQLCLQLAINCVSINFTNTVLYIDTKGDFSAVRVQKILGASGSSHKNMAMIMYKIRVVSIWTMEDLIELFKKIKNKLLVIENLALIIIDSLPCLMFQYLGDTNKIGLSYLNTIVNYSRYICDTFQIAIVCVNIQTRWIDQDFSELEDEEQSTLLKDCWAEKRNRCLGKYWHHIPVTIVMLEKTQGNSATESDSSFINVTVIKLNNLANDKKCVLKLNYLGITGIN